MPESKKESKPQVMTINPARISRRACLLSLIGAGIGAGALTASSLGATSRRAYAMTGFEPSTDQETGSAPGSAGGGLPDNDLPGENSRSGHTNRGSQSESVELKDVVGKKLRVAKFNRPMTMDYSEDRLTVIVDDQGKIVRIYIG